MLKKNIDKLKRNEMRYPPIPYTRVGKSKKDTLNRMYTKYKNKIV